MSSVPTGGRGYATEKEPAHNSVANIPDALMIASILDRRKQAITRFEPQSGFLSAMEILQQLTDLLSPNGPETLSSCSDNDVHQH